MSLATAGPYAPLPMAAVMTLLYILARQPAVIDRFGATASGTAEWELWMPFAALSLSLVVWAIAGVFIMGGLGVASAKPRLYHGLLPYAADLRSALEKLRRNVTSGPEVDILNRIDGELKKVEAILGIREAPDAPANAPLSPVSGDWRSGAAYLALYRRIHAIEADLLLLCTPEGLMTAAIEDYSRLKDSAIEDRDYWRRQVYAAATMLGGDAASHLQPPPAGAVKPSDSKADAANVAEARALLRTVRRGLHEFRDTGFSALLREQSETHFTLMGAGALIYVVVFLGLDPGS